MCGICGIVSLTPDRAVDPDALPRMLDAITHRGPDQSGVHLTDRVGLGSRRLAIIDLANGAQPIADANRSHWIVYDGEVYNYRERRSYLLKKASISIPTPRC